MFEQLLDSGGRSRYARSRKFFIAAGAIYAAAVLVIAIAAVMLFNPRLVEAMSLKVPLVPRMADAQLPRKTVRRVADSGAFQTPSAIPLRPQQITPLAVSPDLPVMNGAGKRTPAPIGYGADRTGNGMPPGSGVPGSGKDAGAPPPPPTSPTPERKASISPVSEGVLRGSAVSRDIPKYPEIAKRSNVQGIVQVLITIAEDGRVFEASVLNGNPVLRQAALDSARRWRFSPTLLSRVPVKVQGVLTFNFKLD